MSEVRPIGNLAGFELVDVFYRFHSKDSPESDDVKWKSILVRTGSDSYVEIYHLQAYYTTVSLAPSQIATSGAESILVTMDSDGGNGRGCWKGYWWFDRSGPHAIDFSAVYAAIRKNTPTGAIFADRCDAINLEAQMIDTSVQSTDAKCRACGQLGSVVADFRLRGWRAVPIRVRFTAAN